MTENLLHKTFSRDPEPVLLWNYLKKNFPGGNYYSACEASFCGFGIHRELEKSGIKNIVANPAAHPAKIETHQAQIETYWADMDGFGRQVIRKLKRILYYQ